MKCRKTLLWFLVAFLLGGCAIEPEPISLPSSPSEPSEPVDLTEFMFSHRGMTADDCFTITILENEDGTLLRLEQDFSGGVILDEPADPALMTQMEALAQQYNVLSWDGFDEINSMVTDGNSFSLSMTLADGEKITACGTNAFPSGYSDFKNQLMQLYWNMI